MKLKLGNPANPIVAGKSGDLKMVNWNKNRVGMIRYSDHWGKYSLVLDVDGMWITELDNFGGHVIGGKPLVRRHCTVLDEKDNFFTMAEFMELLKTGAVQSVDVNNRLNVWPQYPNSFSNLAENQLEERGK